MLGSLLALLLKVDSFELWEHFSDSPASRQVMMDYYEANAERLNNLARTGDTTVGHTAMLKSYAKEMDSLSRAAALPIGWEHSVFHKNTWKKAAKEKGKYKNTGEDQSIWSRIWSSILRFFWGVGIVLSKLPGYLLSGFAASAGAPFWFDLLRRAYSSKTPKS